MGKIVLMLLAVLMLGGCTQVEEDEEERIFESVDIKKPIPVLFTNLSDNDIDVYVVFSYISRNPYVIKDKADEAFTVKANKEETRFFYIDKLEYGRVMNLAFFEKDIGMDTMGGGLDSSSNFIYEDKKIRFNGGFAGFY